MLYKVAFNVGVPWCLGHASSSTPTRGEGPLLLDCPCIFNLPSSVDDIFALLFALAAESEDLEVLLISLTHGNSSVDSYVYCG